MSTWSLCTKILAFPDAGMRSGSSDVSRRQCSRIHSTLHYTTLPTWSFTVLTLVAVFSVRQVSLSVNSSFLLVTKASCVTASSEGTLCDFMWTEPLKANRLDLRFFCEHVIRVQIIRRIDIPLLVGFYFRYRFKCQKPIDLLFFSPFSSCFVGKLKCLDL